MNNVLTGSYNNLNDEIFKIYSKFDESLFFNKTTSNEITVLSENNESNQKWIFKYDQNRDAYAILSYEDTSLCLTLDYQSLKLIAKRFETLDEQYWFVTTQINSNIFAISNYKNPNLYLSISNDKKLTISTINTSDNIKFIFRQPIINELNNKIFRMTNKLLNVSIMRGNDGIPVVYQYDKYKNYEIPDDILIAINKKFGWKFESVNEMWGIFKLKNMEKDVYLACTDKSYVEAILPGIYDGNNMQWKIVSSAENVIRLTNLATNKELISDGIGLYTVDTTSNEAEKLWNLDSLKL